jgi:hypothetical protein
MPKKNVGLLEESKTIECNLQNKNNHNTPQSENTIAFSADSMQKFKDNVN